MRRVLDPGTLRAAWTLLALAGTLTLIYRLRTVLLLLVFSVIFAYLIFPLVKLAERGLPVARRRPLAIALVYLVLVAVLSTLAALVGPRLGHELAALGEKVPAMSTQIQSGRILGNIFPNWGGAEVLDDLVRSHLPQVVVYAQYALTSILAWLSAAWVVILIPVFAFFFLRDAERIADGVTGLVGDAGRRQLSVTIALDLHSVLGEYIRALILLFALTFAVWSALFLPASVRTPWSSRRLAERSSFASPWPTRRWRHRHCGRVLQRVLTPLAAGPIHPRVASHAGLHDEPPDHGARGRVPPRPGALRRPRRRRDRGPRGDVSLGACAGRAPHCLAAPPGLPHRVSLDHAAAHALRINGAPHSSSI